MGNGIPGLSQTLNTLDPRQNGRRFAEWIVKYIWLNEYLSISIEISLEFCQWTQLIDKLWFRLRIFAIRPKEMVWTSGGIVYWRIFKGLDKLITVKAYTLICRKTLFLYRWYRYMNTNTNTKSLLLKYHKDI